MSRKSVHSYNPSNLVCGRLRQHHIHIGLVPAHRALPLPPARAKIKSIKVFEDPAEIELADHLRCQITLVLIRASALAQRGSTLPRMRGCK